MKARFDRKPYEKGEKIADVQMAELNIVEHEVNPHWNYKIYPNKTKKGMKKPDTNKKEKTGRAPFEKSTVVISLQTLKQED